MNETTNEHEGLGPLPSPLPALFLTVFSVFFWMFYIRLPGGFLPIAGPFGPVNIAFNLVLASVVSVPGFVFLYWAQREKPFRALSLWVLSAGLVLSPFLYKACTNVSDSVVSGFIIMGSIYWGKMGLAFMVGATMAMLFMHGLRRTNVVLPLLCAAGLAAYPVYASVKTFQVRYPSVFRGGVPAKVERRYIFLMQALMKGDARYCDRYNEVGDEGSWLGCNNVVRTLKGEALLPSPYPTGKFVGFHPLADFTEDGFGTRAYRRQNALEYGCEFFISGHLPRDCEAFLASNPSKCITAECVIDIAIHNRDPSYCDKIDAEKHQPAVKKPPRRDYVGICYTAVELAKAGVVK